MEQGYNLLEKLKGFYLLTYPWTHLLVVAFLLSAAWIASNSIYFDVRLLLSIILGILWASGVNVLNNIHDIPSDKMHDFDKPLIKKTIKVREAYAFWALIFGISLILAYFINIIALIITIIVPILAILYSGEPFRLKRWDSTTHLIMGLGYGVSLFILAWSLHSPLQTIPLWTLIIFFLMTNVITLAKDYKDINEDLSVGIKTNPAHSLKLAHIFHISYTFIPYALVAFLVFIGTYSLAVLFFLPTIILFLATVFYIMHQSTPEGYTIGYMLSLISGAIAILIFGATQVVI